MQRLLIAALALSFLFAGCRDDDPVVPPKNDTGPVTEGAVAPFTLPPDAVLKNTK